jgi:acyl dehydratase
VVCVNEFSFYIRGLGGFGGKKDSDRGESTASNEPPKRPADFIVKEKTFPDQAALYRLSGDYNPLHIDPQMSAMGGFDVPILHGLCTFGVAGKHIMQKYGDFKSIKARFAKHVFPGETLETHMWKEGDLIIFIVKVVERDAICISNAAARLRSSTVSATKSPVASVGIAVDGFASSAVFKAISEGLSKLPKDVRIAQVKKVLSLVMIDGRSISV